MKMTVLRSKAGSERWRERVNREMICFFHFNIWEDLADKGVFEEKHGGSEGASQVDTCWGHPRQWNHDQKGTEQKCAQQMSDDWRGRSIRNGGKGGQQCLRLWGALVDNGRKELRTSVH